MVHSTIRERSRPTNAQKDTVVQPTSSAKAGTPLGWSVTESRLFSPTSASPGSFPPPATRATDTISGGHGDGDRPPVTDGAVTRTLPSCMPSTEIETWSLMQWSGRGPSLRETTPRPTQRGGSEGQSPAAGGQAAERAETTSRAIGGSQKTRG